MYSQQFFSWKSVEVLGKQLKKLASENYALAYNIADKDHAKIL